jgi:hypothetical protein
MKEQRRAMVKAAQLLEQSADVLRNECMTYDGSVYRWPRSATAIRRLHDDQVRHAEQLRTLAR